MEWFYNRFYDENIPSKPKDKFKIIKDEIEKKDNNLSKTLYPK